MSSSRNDWRALTRAEYPDAAATIFLGRENPLFLCRRAIEEGRRYYAGAAAAAGARSWDGDVERVRERYAAASGAPPGEIAFCSDSTVLGGRLAAHVRVPIRIVEASRTFGLEPLRLGTRPGDVTVVGAHGAAIVHLPPAICDVPTRTFLEGGPQNYAAILAMGGGVDVLLDVGVDASIARVRDVASRLRAALAQHSVPIAAERGRLTIIRQPEPSECIAQLRAAGIVASAEEDGVGLSVHLFTRDEDIDRVIGALSAVRRGERMTSVSRPDGPVVCVDLNGVLDAYQGWQGAAHWDPPAPGAREFLEVLSGRGCRVVLFTTRYYRDAWNWLEAHGLGELVADVTDRKPAADVFVDDRAVPFRGNYENVLQQVEQFTPHWERR